MSESRRSDSSVALRAAGRAPSEDIAQRRALGRLVAKLTGRPEPPLLDRFELVRLLGSGSHGQVYEAWDLRLDRRVGLKLVTDPQHRVLDEARALARIEAPGVVRIHELIEQARCTVVVMQFVDGMTLDAWATKQTVQWRDLVTVMGQVAQALESVHGAGLVHGDIKPSNILVDRQGRAVLIDFSLAGRVRDGMAPAGTPRFMAPEARTSAPSVHSDQYSFFKTLDVLLNEPAGTADEEDETTAAAPEVPDALRAMVQRGLDADPTRRFPSMTAARRAISDLLARRRRRRALGMLTAGGIVVAAAVAFTQIRDTRCRSRSSLGQVWSDGLRAQVEGADLPHGVRPAALTGKIDRAVEAFEAVADARCRAAPWWRAAPEPPSLCLEDARRRIRLVTETLVDDPAAALRRADVLAALLGDPQRCAETSKVAEVELEAPADAEAFLQARETLRRIELTMETQPERAAQSLDALEQMEGVTSCAWRPDAVLLRARHAELSGRIDEATAHTIEAAAEAEACARPRLEFRARVEAVTLLAAAGRRDDARSWVLMSHAALQRTPALDRDAWRLDEVRGWLAYQEGNFAAAMQAYTKAEEQLQRLGKPHDEATSKRISILAIRADPKAVELAQAMVDEQTELYGPGHPNVARALEFLGFAWRSQDRPEQAAATHRRSLAIWEAWKGAFALDRAQTLRQLGSALQASHPEEAAGYLRECISFYETRLPRSPARGDALATLAMVLRNLGRTDEALETGREALEVLEELSGPDAPDTLQVRAAVGQLLLDGGEAKNAAVVSCGAAQRLVETKNAGLTVSPVAFAMCLEAAEQAMDSGDDISDVLDTSWVDPGIEACPGWQLCSEARLRYGRILGAWGRVEQARMQVDKGRALAEAGGADLAPFDRWLREHPKAERPNE